MQNDGNENKTGIAIHWEFKTVGLNYKGKRKANICYKNKKQTSK